MGSLVRVTLAGMAVRLSRDEWDTLTLQLLVRSGGMCEARTPACLAGPDGRVTDRRDRRVVPVSRHHRQPRGMGGSSLDGQHGLDVLLLVCGDGTTGCHGFIEGNRELAERWGLLVPHGDGMDPAAIPVTLASGRLVLLDPRGGFYLEIGMGQR